MGYRKDRQRELLGKLEAANAGLTPEELGYKQTQEGHRRWNQRTSEDTIARWTLPMGVGAVLFWTGDNGFFGQYVDGLVWWGGAAFFVAMASWFVWLAVRAANVKVALARKTQPWSTMREREVLNEIEAANPSLSQQERRRLLDRELDRRERMDAWDHRLYFAASVVALGAILFGWGHINANNTPDEGSISNSPHEPVSDAELEALFQELGLEGTQDPS